MDVLAVGARLGVHIAGGVEERGDLLCGAEVGSARLGPPDAALALRDVAIDQLALRSGREQRAEQGERHVDRPRAERALGELRGLVAVDLRDRDLRQGVLAEERDQVVLEPPAVIRARGGAQLALALDPPQLGELMERRVDNRLGRVRRLVRLPCAARARRAAHARLGRG